ncbi:hypothetical protein D9M70_326270 [compost metagenome]
MLDHQGAGVHLAAVRGPLAGGIAGGIAGLGQGQQQAPAHRTAGEALLQVAGEEVRVLAGIAQGLERRFRLYRPAHEAAVAGSVQQLKGVDPVVGDIGEAIAWLAGPDPLTEGGRFRVGGEEGLQLRWVGLAGGGIGPRGQHLLVEGLRGGHRQHRRAVHSGAPLLAARQPEQQRHAAHGHPGIRCMGVAAAYGEAADHRELAGGEDAGAGQLGRLPVAVEMATDADAFRVVLAVAGKLPGVGLEGVDDVLRGQAFAADPAAGIGEGRGQAADGESDQGQPCRQVGPLGRCVAHAILPGVAPLSMSR